MKLPQTNLCLQLPLYSCCNVIFEYSGQRQGTHMLTYGHGHSQPPSDWAVITWKPETKLAQTILCLQLALYS